MPYQEPTTEEIQEADFKWAYLCRRHSNLLSAKNIHLHSEKWANEAVEVCNELQNFARHWECIRHADGSELEGFAIEARIKLLKMLNIVWAWKSKTRDGE